MGVATFGEEGRNISLIPSEEYEPIEDKAVQKLAGMVNQAEFRTIVLALGLGEAVGRYAEKVNGEQARLS